MKRTVVFAAALAAMLPLGFAGRHALAQGQMPMSSGHTPSSHISGGNMPGRISGGKSGGYMPGSGDGAQYADEFSSDGWSTGGYSNGSCSSCGDPGCCDDCEYGGETGCDSSWWDCCGIVGGQPRCYFMADYLYVRASFSEAVAYIERDDSVEEDQHDIVHELNFQYEPSYRFGGGYRLGCCDEEVRFMFTRLSSGADAVAPQGSFVPYEVIGPDTDTFISADVDVKSFDLDFRKTIRLGGPQCCGCGDSCEDACCDPCGCGDACCAPACPAWDITWSGGVRFADVNWNRYYATYFDDGEIFRDATPTLSFRGGGPRVGLEGRRYFGTKNRCSVFLKGDISVLLGQMNERIQTVRELGDRLSLEAQGRRIIPVTEIEAGLSAQLTCNSMVSAGYLFSAWHDLGFRDQFDIQTLVESNSTDTANILGFDGLFVRFELGY